MEFRLSENTVSTFEEYKKERNRYAGADGADGGNWMAFRDWLVSENFTCTWRDSSWPVKNNGQQLGTDICGQIASIIGASGSALLGVQEGADEDAHTCTDVPCEHGDSIYIATCGLGGRFIDASFGFKNGEVNELQNILFVRPI